jgi:ABC-type multidrug transport system fused ATPase/permease subunit
VYKEVASLKAYFTFVKPYWVLIVITIIIGIIKFAIPLTLPLLLLYVIDHLVLADIPTEEKITKLTYVIAGTAVVFVLFRGPIEYYRQYFAQLITSKVLFDIRNHLYGHIQKLSIRYYQNRKVGEIISRFVNDVEQTRNIVEVGMMNIWLDMFTLTIALGFLFYLDPVLALVSILIFPFYGIAVQILHKRLRILSKNRSQALAEIQGYLHERIQGVPVIRSFTLEAYENRRFERKNQNYLNKALAQTKWNALTFGIINTITDIAPLMVLAYGGYKMIQGDLTVGEFVAFFAYLERLYAPLRRLVNSSTVLTQATASMDRVLEFMNETYDITDSPDSIAVPAVSGDVAFDHVSFNYNGEEGPMVLKNINLSIKSGETIAFVGMSGGGKSSLVSLIPRFYDINEGSIRLDGRDIRDFTIKSLRQKIGMVLQDNFLFSGTVRENIMLGNPSCSDQEMIDAAVSASAHEFITKLPNGYDTEIGERGVKLSGGQKQRIAIARVFLKDPQILILDEATSALDLESEALIQHSLANLAKDRTTLIVAHRLSTITHADQIILIEDGEIKERGTHPQLMQSDGAYARLFNVQNLSAVGK